MNLQEIKGFPDYMFNTDTGEIVSKLRGKKHLKISHQFQKTAPAVQMKQGDKRRWIFLNRLMYCIQQGIGYDEIPEGLFVTKNEKGEYQVIDKRGQIDIANNKVKAARKRERIKRIDEKIHELEIMRRAYTEGSHTEAVQYIESRKELLICHHAKKHGTSCSKAELIYNIALDRIIDRIDSPTSQITELTVSMMSLMNKIWTKLRAERPLELRDETPSNSIIKPI